MEGVWLTRSTSVAHCIVAMATCVIANLRCSKTKLSSVAESSRGVNHYLQTHTDTWRHEATAGTDQSLRATLWCDQTRDVHCCRGHLNIRHLLLYLLALFIEEHEKHFSTPPSNTESEWQWCGFFRLKLWLWIRILCCLKILSWLRTFQTSSTWWYKQYNRCWSINRITQRKKEFSIPAYVTCAIVWFYWLSDANWLITNQNMSQQWLIKLTIQ